MAGPVRLEVTPYGPPYGDAVPSARRTTLIRRIRFLVLFTIAYNLLEAVVALIVGSDAGSSALLGFGLDSAIEVSSALAVAWQFAGGDHETRERVALRAIALSFFGLAAFLVYDSLHALIGQHEPEHSPAGMVLAALSLVVMPAASYLQRNAGTELGSASAVADSKQAMLCTYMSAALLLGLLANAVGGWWWADPGAALVIALFALREGVSASRGEACCAPTGALFARHEGIGADGCGCGPACAGCC